MRRREITRKKRPIIMYGRQKSRFSEQVSEGSAPTPVFARVHGEATWLEAGHISVAEGSGSTTADAARHQKRLILEHATRVHRHLQLHREALECGLGMPAADDELAEKIVLIERGTPAEEGSMSNDNLLVFAATCGFSGAPIPDAGHYFSDSSTDQVAKDARNVNIQNAFGNAAKSEVAVQASKTLGLRSLG